MTYDLTFTASVVLSPFERFVDGIVFIGEWPVFKMDLTEVPAHERAALLDERFAEALLNALGGD